MFVSEYMNTHYNIETLLSIQIQTHTINMMILKAITIVFMMMQEKISITEYTTVS